MLIFSSGYQDARTRQMAFPFTKNLTTEYIVKFARKLWDEATQPMAKGNMRLSNVRSTGRIRDSG